MLGAAGSQDAQASQPETARASYAPGGPRPEGELVWLHAGQPESGRAKTDLARELLRNRDGLSVLLTTHDPGLIEPTKGLIIEPIPSDEPNVVHGFSEHWSPDLGLWMWGGLRPRLIQSVWKHGTPMHLVDASQEGFDRARDDWLNEVPRHLLAHFDTFHARSDAAQARLLQMGCAQQDVERVPPLRPIGQTLPFVASDLEELRAAVTGRPVWFARGIERGELDIVLEAHRGAMRSAPRLLIIIEPARQEDAEWMIGQIQNAKLRLSNWIEGDFPNESAQVLFATEPDETGLWYSLAAVSFIGRSFLPGGQSWDPYEAAAHGSVILHGPNMGLFKRSFSRLSNANAARLVPDGGSLAAAVSRLSSPDKAAHMAMAAWDVISEGAAATERILSIVNDSLDKRRGQSA